MTTETLKEPAGWKGNTFYIGVKAYPIKVIVIREKPYEALLKTVEVLPEVPEMPTETTISPNSDVHKPVGRPPVTLTPKQLEFMDKKMTIREKALAMGISKSKVALLMKGSK